MTETEIITVLSKIRIGIRDNVQLDTDHKTLMEISHRVLRQITQITND